MPIFEVHMLDVIQQKKILRRLNTINVFDFEYLPIGAHWYQKNEKRDRKKSIDDTVLSYKKFKKKLLSA